MEREKKVLDASVIIKLFAKEEGSNKALALINRHVTKKIIIIVPELMFLEVSNAIFYKKADENALIRISKDLFNFQFKVEKLTESILNKAITFSIKNNITIYDSVYIAIAQLHGAHLITADSRLYNLPSVIPLEKTN